MSINLLRRSDAGREIISVEYHVLGNGEKVPLLVFPDLKETGMVKHCFTTRMGGVSDGIFSTLNLSFTRGDDYAAVRENYRRVAEAMGVDLNRMVCSHQTHTTNVRVVTGEDAGKGITVTRDYEDVDGLITDVSDLTLALFFADCVPLYFVDPVHRAIGLSHSGWRGTVNRMGECTLKAMSAAYDTRPGDVICAIGPSICQSCYEVSADVADQFASAFPGHEKEILAFHGTDADGGSKYSLDLWKANEIILLDAGITPDHLSVTDICTCCNSDILFSHRASHGKRGNLGAFLSLL
ncbi:MAG: peptidoglycan editing factor PgeF [Clostridiales bacterium]|nr:peptidoglycan editing factor PgeF [Clostridiales bacterium]